MAAGDIQLAERSHVAGNPQRTEHLDDHNRLGFHNLDLPDVWIDTDHGHNGSNGHSRNQAVADLDTAIGILNGLGGGILHLRGATDLQVPATVTVTTPILADGGGWAGPLIRPSANNVHAFFLDTGADGTTIQNCRFNPTSTTLEGVAGIHRQAKRVTIQNCRFQNMGRTVATGYDWNHANSSAGIILAGTTANPEVLSDWGKITNCNFAENYRGIVMRAGAGQTHMTGLEFQNSTGGADMVVERGAGAANSRFQLANTHFVLGDNGIAGVADEGYSLYLTHTTPGIDGLAAQISNVAFEGSGAVPANAHIYLDATSCQFANISASAGAAVLECSNVGNDFSNQFDPGVYTSVSAEYVNANAVNFKGRAVFTDATRPAATAVNAGYMVWNSDDAAPNWSDGTIWRDATGVAT